MENGSYLLLSMEIVLIKRIVASKYNQTHGKRQLSAVVDGDDGCTEEEADALKERVRKINTWYVDAPDAPTYRIWCGADMKGFAALQRRVCSANGYRYPSMERREK